MTLTNSELGDFLKVLGFSLIDGQSGVYAKRYHDGNEIKADVKCNSIDYGQIKTQRKTTSNFGQKENLVVLECVNRLLEKGYRSKDIELEKTWQLGRKQKGYLDIHVVNRGKSFLMIECKTWDEYDKAKIDTQSSEKSGGQIFSYLQQDPKDTVAILYYASKLKSGKIIYQNAVIFNKPEWAGLNQEDRFNNWSKVYESKGIFDVDAKPYQITQEGLKVKELMPLSSYDSNAIYNQFAEILRHNVVSDKPNAFSKIINLFLCKITDESGNDEDLCKFHTITNGRQKTNEELFEDLNDLYKRGMENYLKKNISDFTQDEFKELESAISDSSRKSLIKEMYVALRLYKNNEFAFKEVFDKVSFEDNAKVVREVVEMLQGLKLRYTHKQQFLGDFFEKLLNDSIKQESGQFFTPTPIAEFIVRSLPFKECIQGKIKSLVSDPLPYVIDYACGTGHFLTEVMDYLNNIIKNEIDIKSLGISKDNANKFRIWKNSDFEWAKDYIYGIDLDYRLTKSTKINCFLNGDGEASIIHADGLAPFSCSAYTGILHDPQARDLEKFDFVISNPPFAVKAFAKTLDSKNVFDLQSELTEKSNEIQCLFLERAKQLLKIDGFMALILPQSILFASGINAEARKLLLKHFEIKAIMVLGSKTFMATGVNTCVIFAKRRKEDFYNNIVRIVDKFLTDYQDVALAGIDDAFSAYVNYTYPELSFDDYVRLLQGKTPETQVPHEFSFLENDKELKKNEREKLIYFHLTFSSKIILANSEGIYGDGNEEAFLGYSFSNRRGQEGIKLNRDSAGRLITLMFSEDPYDPEKLSSYILRSCLGEDLAQDVKCLKDAKSPLAPHIDYCRLAELLSFRDPNFILEIKNQLPPPELNRRYHRQSLDYSVSEIISGKRPQGGVGTLTSGVISLGGENIERDSGFLNVQSPEYIDDAFFKKHKLEKVKENDILICKDGALTGKIALVRDELKDRKTAVNEHLFILRANPNHCLQHYLFYYLKSRLGQAYLKYHKRGSAQGGLNAINIRKVMISLPPMEVQNAIVKELKETDIEIIRLKQEIKDLDEQVKSRFVEMFGNPIINSKNFKETSFINVVKLQRGFDLPVQDRVDNCEIKFPVYGSNGILGYHNKYKSENGIVTGRSGTIGKIYVAEGKYWPLNTTLFSVEVYNNNLIYLKVLLEFFRLDRFLNGTGVPTLNRNLIHKEKIIDVSLKLQNEFACFVKQTDKSKLAKQDQILELTKKYDEVIERYLL